MKTSQSRFLEKVETTASTYGLEASFDQTVASNVGVVSVAFEDQLTPLVRWHVSFQAGYTEIELETPVASNADYPQNIRARFAVDSHDTWHAKPEDLDEVIRSLAKICARAVTARQEAELA